MYPKNQAFEASEIIIHCSLDCVKFIDRQYTHTHTLDSRRVVLFVVQRQIGQMVDVWWECGIIEVKSHVLVFICHPHRCVGKCEATKCNILKDAETQHKLLTENTTQKRTVSIFVKKNFDHIKLFVGRQLKERKISLANFKCFCCTI